MKILLVEDNLDLAESLSDYLSEQHIRAQAICLDFAYSVSMAESLLAESALANDPFDCIILDINLPDGSGVDLCKKITQQLMPHAAIIMLTAREALADKLACFNNGADDYMVKPFAMAELMARLNVISARHQPMQQTVLQVGDLIFDTDAQVIKRGDVLLDVNNAGKKILSLLMENSPNPVKKKQIEHQLWGDKPSENDSVKTYIHYLRKRVDDPFETAYLLTVRGVGYVMRAESL